LILEWCKYLREQGCEVDALSTDGKTIDELRKIEGVAVIESILIPRDIALLPDANALISLIKLLHRRHYDIVHTYTATPGFIGRIASRLAGTPVILHHQAGWTVTEFSSRKERILYAPLEYLASLASTRSICVSHAVAQQATVLKIPKRKLVTICNGIAPEPFISAIRGGFGFDFRRELGVSAECVLIGGTGRLAAQKDNATLIRSLVSLKALLPGKQVLLILAGDGPEKQKLESLAYSLGVSEQVRFLGFCANIPGLLGALDVFASSTLREGLSISLMEAMAAAKPIVTTSILPNAELIQHEITGLLVSPREPEQVAYAIARFVSDPDLAQRCGAAAQQRVLDHYTIDRMFQETWDLYMQLLKEKRPSRT
jgi:glycosyltransferase involved in cell wall biosynthesis